LLYKKSKSKKAGTIVPAFPIYQAKKILSHQAYL